MLALSLKVLKEDIALKIVVVDNNPTVGLTFPGKQPKTRVSNIHFPLTVLVYLRSDFRGRLRKSQLFFVQ